MRIKPEMAFEFAIRKLVERELRKLRDLKVATLHGEVEAVHDFRAGLRRIRALLEVGAGGKARRLRKRAGEFARSLGEVRDLDVVLSLIEEGALGSADTSDWSINLEEQRKARLDEARSLLDSPQFLGWSQKLVQWAHRGKGKKSAREGLSAALRNVVGEARKHAEGTSEKDLHRLRISVKKARYLVELFSDLFSPRSKAVAEKLERAQDAFGADRDRLRLVELACERTELHLFLDALPSGADQAQLVALAADALDAAEALARELA